jgi:hypothetical protein
VGATLTNFPVKFLSSECSSNSNKEAGEKMAFYGEQRNKKKAFSIGHASDTNCPGSQSCHVQGENTYISVKFTSQNISLILSVTFFLRNKVEDISYKCSDIA